MNLDPDNYLQRKSIIDGYTPRIQELVKTNYGEPLEPKYFKMFVNKGYQGTGSELFDGQCEYALNEICAEQERHEKQYWEEKKALARERFAKSSLEVQACGTHGTSVRITGFTDAELSQEWTRRTTGKDVLLGPVSSRIPCVLDLIDVLQNPVDANESDNADHTTSHSSYSWSLTSKLDHLAPTKDAKLGDCLQGSRTRGLDDPVKRKAISLYPYFRISDRHKAKTHHNDLTVIAVDYDGGDPEEDLEAERQDPSILLQRIKRRLGDYSPTLIKVNHLTGHWQAYWVFTHTLRETNKNGQPNKVWHRIKNMFVPLVNKVLYGDTNFSNARMQNPMYSQIGVIGSVTGSSDVYYVSSTWWDPHELAYNGVKAICKENNLEPVKPKQDDTTTHLRLCKAAWSQVKTDYPWQDSTIDYFNDKYTIDSTGDNTPTEFLGDGSQQEDPEPGHESVDKTDDVACLSKIEDFDGFYDWWDNAGKPKSGSWSFARKLVQVFDFDHDVLPIGDRNNLLFLLLVGMYSLQWPDSKIEKHVKKIKFEGRFKPAEIKRTMDSVAKFSRRLEGFRKLKNDETIDADEINSEIKLAYEKLYTTLRKFGSRGGRANTVAQHEARINNIAKRNAASRAIALKQDHGRLSLLYINPTLSYRDLCSLLGCSIGTITNARKRLLKSIECDLLLSMQNDLAVLEKTGILTKLQVDDLRRKAMQVAHNSSMLLINSLEALRVAGCAVNVWGWRNEAVRELCSHLAVEGEWHDLIASALNATIKPSDMLLEGSWEAPIELLKPLESAMAFVPWRSKSLYTVIPVSAEWGSPGAEPRKLPIYASIDSHGRVVPRVATIARTLLRSPIADDVMISARDATCTMQDTSPADPMVAVMETMWRKAREQAARRIGIAPEFLVKGRRRWVIDERALRSAIAASTCGDTYETLVSLGMRKRDIRHLFGKKGLLDDALVGINAGRLAAAVKRNLTGRTLVKVTSISVRDRIQFVRIA